MLGPALAVLAPGVMARVLRRLHHTAGALDVLQARVVVLAAVALVLGLLVLLLEALLHRARALTQGCGGGARTDKRE